ncbi:MAG: hypothetical protein DHS20C15_09380 [Planctomycetota bacterium]|nr:MAG: hypothetical protein DHS20C15_09380 [Planctomycetota bacterium]
MKAALAIVLLAALGALAAPAAQRDTAADTPREGELQLARARGSLRFADFAWRLDGLAQPKPERVTAGDLSEIRLPWKELGERWSCVFAVEQAESARLQLEWTPDERGLVYEILINGEPLVPARDGWRPSARTLHSDLGTRWFGPGRHLVEFVCRESGGGALRLRSLKLETP